MNNKRHNNIEIIIIFSIYLLLLYGIYSLGQKYKNPHPYYKFIKTEENRGKERKEIEEAEEYGEYYNY